MFGDLLGGLVNKEQIAFDAIQDALYNLAAELKCDHTDFFVMIKPSNYEFEPKFYLYQVPTDKNSLPKFVREISLKEILGDKKEEE